MASDSCVEIGGNRYDIGAIGLISALLARREAFLTICSKMEGVDASQTVEMSITYSCWGARERLPDISIESYDILDLAKKQIAMIDDRLHELKVKICK